MDKRAGFWRRAAAFALDALPIVVLVWWLSGALDLPGHDLARQPIPPADPDEGVSWYLAREARRSVAILLYLIYAALLESSSLQATLGKRVFGLKTVSVDGGRLSRGRAFGRNAAKIISYIPLGLGFFWAAIPPEKKGWHDRIADTQVVVHSAR